MTRLKTRKGLDGVDQEIVHNDLAITVAAQGRLIKEMGEKLDRVLAAQEQRV